MRSATCKDTHDGSTGSQNMNNVYELKVRDLQPDKPDKPDKPVTLVMEVEPMSSVQTRGDIEIARGPPQHGESLKWPGHPAQSCQFYAP